jgi:hypothetical protein
MRDKDILLQDAFTDLRYSRPGNDLIASGLFIDLPAWGYHLFKFRIN